MYKDTHKNKQSTKKTNKRSKKKFKHNISYVKERNMIELTFVKNHAIRKVFIKDKTVTLITPEMNYQTIIIDEEKYNKLRNDDKMKKLSELSQEDLEKLNDKRVVNLVNDIKINIDFNDTEFLRKDLINDFQDSGWRCIKHG